eukprot:364730-Chlamydomonas_euryale.AAC.4
MMHPEPSSQALGSSSPNTTRPNTPCRNRHVCWHVCCPDGHTGGHSAALSTTLCCRASAPLQHAHTGARIRGLCACWSGALERQSWWACMHGRHGGMPSKQHQRRSEISTSVLLKVVSRKQSAHTQGPRRVSGVQEASNALMGTHAVSTLGTKLTDIKIFEARLAVVACSDGSPRMLRKNNTDMAALHCEAPASLASLALAACAC